MKPKLFERLGDDFIGAFGASVLVSGPFGSRTITAIYRAFRVNDALQSDYPGVESASFVLSGRAADLCDIAHDDVIVVDGKDHKVISAVDDARAMRRLFLADYHDSGAF